MIDDIPTPEDFIESGKELLNFAWDITAILLTDFVEAEELDVDTAEITEEYWDAAKKRLSTVLAMTQQAVELILKGQIARVSPYLLLIDSPGKWPSPYDGRKLNFSQFKTVEAQELIRLHDTVSAIPLNAIFIDKFNALRLKRNVIFHSIDKKLVVHITEVIETILSMHKWLFPAENWATIRAEFIEKAPVSILYGGDGARNIACRELDAVLQILSPSLVKEYFHIDKKQRRYICPECYSQANRDAGFEYRLAVLRPKNSASNEIYCPICNEAYKVNREACGQDNCPGNVISADEGICLTCGCFID